MHSLWNLQQLSSRLLMQVSELSLLKREKARANKDAQRLTQKHMRTKSGSVVWAGRTIHWATVSFYNYTPSHLISFFHVKFPFLKWFNLSYCQSPYHLLCLTQSPCHSSSVNGLTPMDTSLSRCPFSCQSTAPYWDMNRTGLELAMTWTRILPQ